jgi:hypothetical protein
MNESASIKVGRQQPQSGSSVTSSDLLESAKKNAQIEFHDLSINERPSNCKEFF